MPEGNTWFGLTIWEPDFERQLAAIGDGKPFKWQNIGLQKQAKEHFEAAALAYNMGIEGQMKLQLQEVLRLSFEDFLNRHHIRVSFGESVSESFPLNTPKILLSPAVFDLLKILEDYPFPQVFGRNGLDLESLRIAEKKGECLLQVRFLKSVCAVRSAT